MQQQPVYTVPAGQPQPIAGYTIVSCQPGRGASRRGPQPARRGGTCAPAALLVHSLDTSLARPQSPPPIRAATCICSLCMYIYDDTGALGYTQRCADKPHSSCMHANILFNQVPPQQPPNQGDVLVGWEVIQVRKSGQELAVTEGACAAPALPPHHQSIPPPPQTPTARRCLLLRLEHGRLCDPDHPGLCVLAPLLDPDGLRLLQERERVARSGAGF